MNTYGQTVFISATSTPPSHLCHRTKYYSAASWEGEASTCSDVPVPPFQNDGARRSPDVTGNHVVHRWWCTVSTGRRASKEHRLLWNSSSRCWACKHKHIDIGLKDGGNVWRGAFLLKHKIRFYSSYHIWASTSHGELPLNSLTLWLHGCLSSQLYLSLNKNHDLFIFLTTEK